MVAAEMKVTVAQMSEEELLEELAELRSKLDELRAQREEEVPSEDPSLADDKGEELQQEELQRLRGLRLIDGVLLSACLDGNAEGAELMLSIILGKPDIHVTSVKAQPQAESTSVCDVVLAIVADDDAGKDYRIEVRKVDDDTDERGARLHSASLDARSSGMGQNLEDLPESYVIFINEDDVFGAGLPLYTVERRITNMGQPFDDGEHIIYVNCSFENASTELGKLAHDLLCTDPDDMNYRELADAVRYFKKHEEGMAAMCKVLKDSRTEPEPTCHSRAESVLRWIAMGLPYEQIAKGEGITLEEVQEIAATQKA